MIKKIGSVISSHRKELKLSQADLADALASYGFHIKNAAVSAWEKDVSTPGASQFLALCKILGITDIYSEFIEPNPSDPLSGLNQAGREKVLDYISLLLLSDNYRHAPAEVIPFRRKIKFSLLPTSAGTGNYLDDENFEEIEVGSEVPPEADFGVRISGNSMEPRFSDSQTIWIQKTDQLNSGDIGLFFYDDRTYCKVLKNGRNGLSLLSLNPDYAPIKIDPSKTFQVFGRVLC